MARTFIGKEGLRLTYVAPYVLAGILCASRLAAEDSLLNGLANGPLDGQGMWSASSGFEVRDGTDASGGNQILEITDSVPESLEADFPLAIANTGSVTFRARANSLASARVSSGLFVVLSCSLNIDGTPPDPFFMIGFGPNGNDIAWGAPGTGIEGSANGVVGEGSWYQFDVTFDISHGEFGDQNSVNFSVTDMASGNVIAKENLVYPNQNGPRKILSSLKLVTGGKHADSVWEVGRLTAEPEPR